MSYIRGKKIGKKTYYYIVDNVKEDGKRKQKVLAYLGTAEKILKNLKSL